MGHTGGGSEDVLCRSGDGQDGSLPLPPPLLLLRQLGRGVGEEHHLLLVLDLPLEELQRRAVEAHHVLGGGGRGMEGKV